MIKKKTLDCKTNIRCRSCYVQRSLVKSCRSFLCIGLINSNNFFYDLVLYNRNVKEKVEVALFELSSEENVLHSKGVSKS